MGSEVYVVPNAHINICSTTTPTPWWHSDHPVSSDWCVSIYYIQCCTPFWSKTRSQLLKRHILHLSDVLLKIKLLSKIPYSRTQIDYTV